MPRFVSYGRGPRHPRENLLPLKLCRISDGFVLVSLMRSAWCSLTLQAETYVGLYPHKALSFLELCGTTLLIKQEGTSLRAHELIRKRQNCRILRETQHFSPESVSFLYVSLRPRIQSRCAQPPCRSPPGHFTFTALHGSHLDVFVCSPSSLRKHASLQLNRGGGHQNLQ